MMLGTTPPYVAPPAPVPSPLDAGPETYRTYATSSLNMSFPNAIEGDGVIIIAPTDGEELWVKVGGGWMLGDVPGSQRMTGEYRPSPKRIIFDATKGDKGYGPAPWETMKSSGVGTGHIVLLGLLGLLLLRGAIK